MSGAALTERPLRPFLEPPSDLGRAGTGHTLTRSGKGGPTLGQTLDRVWEGLLAGRVAECPVCHGRMATSAAGESARCGECGSCLG